MKKLLMVLAIGVAFTSCEKEEEKLENNCGKVERTYISEDSASIGIILLMKETALTKVFEVDSGEFKIKDFKTNSWVCLPKDEVGDLYNSNKY